MKQTYGQPDEMPVLLKNALGYTESEVPTPVCMHTGARTLYLRTRAGAKHSRLIPVGKLCDCGQATIDQA